MFKTKQKELQIFSQNDCKMKPIFMSFNKTLMLVNSRKLMLKRRGKRSRLVI